MNHHHRLAKTQVIPPLTLRAVVETNIARSVSDGFGAVKKRLGKRFVRA